MRFPDDVPTLTAGPVTLRAHRSDDVPGVYEQCIDPISQRWTTVPMNYTREDATAFVARRGEMWEQDRDWGFAIEAPGGGGPTSFGGTISLEPKGSGIAEIAFGTHPGVRGRGIMTTAARLILDWGFTAQGLQTVLWQCNAGNYGSWRVAWKNGFTFEGRSREALPQRGKALDAWHATLLAADSREPKTDWMRTARLEANGLVVRDVAETDEKRYLETTTDRESMTWLGAIPMPRTAGAFQRVYRDRLLQASLGSALRWSVADAGDDRYLGSVSLFGLDGLDYKSGEVGYHVHPDARGRGVMTTALRLVLAHAFAAEFDGGLGLQRVSLGAAASNPASQGVARSCGFTETGLDRRCYELPDGSVDDLMRFDILNDELLAPPSTAVTR
jgi:RimJ/RimL family protein N-acetyltransferase